MRKIVIETKLPLRRVEGTLKRVHGSDFYSRIKRGQIYIYCAQHITDEAVKLFAKELGLVVISKSQARVVLRH